MEGRRRKKGTNRLGSVSEKDSIRLNLPRDLSDFLAERPPCGLSEDEPLEDAGDGESEAHGYELFGAAESGRVEAGTSPRWEVAAVGVLKERTRVSKGVQRSRKEGDRLL